MKSKSLAIFISAIGWLTFGCSQELNSNQPPELPQPSDTVKPGRKLDKSGKFVKGQHTTLGTAQIITQSGKRYLELSQTFKTDSGPDLLVLLHREKTPTKYNKQDFVSLGRLQQGNGTQRYTIPEQVNLAEFGSVVIWCRLFNVTFGYAPLNS